MKTALSKEYQMHNVVALVGNLGTDVETRYSASGSPWGTARLAVNDHYNDAQGAKQQKTYWFNIVFFGKNAEIASTYAGKGAKIGIIGKLTERVWEDNQGQKRSTIEVRVDTLELLGKPGGGQENGGQQNRQPNNGQQNRNQQRPPQTQGQTEELPPPPSDGPDEEIPF
jgi:single-strand DNA-binding protein